MTSLAFTRSACLSLQCFAFHFDSDKARVRIGMGQLANPESTKPSKHHASLADALLIRDRACSARQNSNSWQLSPAANSEFGFTGV